MARQKSTNPVARVVSAVLLLGIASSVATLLVIGGCFRNTAATPGATLYGETAPAQSPLAEQLAGKRRELEDRQRQRLDLLTERKVQLAQLTADLKTSVRRVDMDLDELLTEFQTKPPQSGPAAELYLLYRRCAQLEVHVRRLTEAHSADGKLVGQLQLAEENFAQQAELNAALDPGDRDQALALLEQAGREDKFDPENILSDPALAADLQSAMQDVQQSLRHRASLLPSRPEKAITDLPPLPALDAIQATKLAEKELLKQLQKLLAEGRAAAEKQLAAGRPESAIDDLQNALAAVRRELDAFPRAPAWKSTCVEQLDATTAALSAQLAGPYLTALEAAIPPARESSDWSGVLDLLEELVRLVPRSTKLSELVVEIDELIQWQKNVGDLDAAVAAERFQAIRRGLNLGPSKELIAMNVNLAMSLRLPEAAAEQIDVRRWRAAQATLVQSLAEYRNAGCEEFIAHFAQDEARIQEKQQDLEAKKNAVYEKIQARTREDSVIREKLQDTIATKERALQRLSEASERLIVQFQIEELKAAKASLERHWQEARGYGAGADISDLQRLHELTGPMTGSRLTLRYKERDVSFRWCPPGSFTMGSPIDETGRNPDNERNIAVILSSGFFMAEVETTQELWRSVTNEKIEQLSQRSSLYSKKEPLPGVGNDFPVYYVSQEQCMAFCAKLTREWRAAGHLPIDWRISLPTDAQWEYAARAGSDSAFCFGDDEGRIGDLAWYGQNARDRAHPVGQRKANNWGLFDMHGNVLELCADDYVDLVLGGTDPVNKNGEDSTHCVVRGGVWITSASNCRSAKRARANRSFGHEFAGFRIAIVQEPAQSQ